jgi:hypothetical protein
VPVCPAARGFSGFRMVCGAKTLSDVRLIYFPMSGTSIHLSQDLFNITAYMYKINNTAVIVAYILPLKS